MKRLVWLFLAAFCLAVAQVQPVDVPAKQHAKCGCCEGEDDSCGMKDCAPPPPASTQARLVLETPALTVRAESRKDSVARRVRHETFYVQFVPRSNRPADLAPQGVAPAASVPVYQAHCSYLI
jgi:hypothetical protein